MTQAPHRDRCQIQAYQLDALRKLIRAIAGHNRFYCQRLVDAGLDGGITSLADFIARMPVTDKEQIVADQLACAPYGSNLTYPLDHYTHVCQTSGTTGTPLYWLDTPQSWQWMLDNWTQVYRAAGVNRHDRVMYLFSFGPFLGFWTAYEAAAQMGIMTIAGGGMSSRARLQMIMDHKVTVLCCTPTYAMHLADVAAAHHVTPGESKVRKIIVAGEPGGSIPTIRARIERLWPGAVVVDHHGLTEVGPVSFTSSQHRDILHIIETSYLAEVVDPATLEHVAPGQTGELILTTLGRLGSPLLRYRTGDLVCPSTRSAAELGQEELALEGGILGRTDDMVFIRGVNVFPSTIDAMVRTNSDIVEYRVDICQSKGLTEMKLTIEPGASHDQPSVLCQRLAAQLRDGLHLRVPVTAAAPGTLPRFEMKAQRWFRHKKF